MWNHGISSESVKIPNHVDQNWLVADPSPESDHRYYGLTIDSIYSVTVTEYILSMV